MSKDRAASAAGALLVPLTMRSLLLARCVKRRVIVALPGVTGHQDMPPPRGTPLAPSVRKPRGHAAGKELGGGERSRDNVARHVSSVRTHAAQLPAAGDLERAAAVLNAGKRIAILAGRGALGAGDELLRVAEVLQAPIAKALLGKAVVPDDSPYSTGGIGLLGTRPSQEALEHCDTLLMVGTSFPYIEFLPKPGKTRGVQIDLDPVRIGLRYPVEVGLVGDARATLAEPTPAPTPPGSRATSRSSAARCTRCRRPAPAAVSSRP